jgi:predicted transcriptional regulator
MGVTLSGSPLAGWAHSLSSVEMEGSEGFNLFGDPDELRERLGELAEQMQSTQRVAWADNAIKLAVDMTVAAINGLDLNGSSDEQAVQVRDAIRIVFPEAVTLVREAREGLS